MSRRGNWTLWAGLAAVLAGIFSYQFFIRFPLTRDFPWVNLALLAAGMVLLITGLVRAFGRPQMYRGRILGTIFAVLALVGVGFFCYLTFFLLHDLPASTGAPKVGDKAPAFTLPDQNGKPTALADLISPNGAILIFYRGHW
jgi:drug/metabolite transporter (DMT)-like permease